VTPIHKEWVAKRERDGIVLIVEPVRAWQTGPATGGAKMRQTSRFRGCEDSLGR
jgi:hypothetical protein